jgi:hypothetical protein
MMRLRLRELSALLLRKLSAPGGSEKRCVAVPENFERSTEKSQQRDSDAGSTTGDPYLCSVRCKAGFFDCKEICVRSLVFHGVVTEAYAPELRCSHGEGKDPT